MTPSTLASTVGCSAPLAELYADHISEACRLFGIHKITQLAMFLAQVGHESRSLSVVRENLNYSVEGLLSTFGRHRITEADARNYGRATGRKANQEAIANTVYGGEWGARNLGNTQPGDGYRYPGRALIQITGRGNYAKARDHLRAVLGDVVPDFEAEPEALELPRWAALSAGAFWDWNHINAIADTGDFVAVTKKVNGGVNGLEDRQQRHLKALAVLRAQAAETPVDKPQAPAAPQVTTPQPAPPAAKDPAMPIPSIILSLGSALISAFTPLAKEKIQREIARHTDRPEIAEQITAAVVEAARAATGKSDPIEAVAEARADPEVMTVVEASSLDRLSQMAPLLQQLDVMDRQAFLDGEASRDAAAARAQTDTMKDDMGKMLAYGGLAVVLLLIVFVGVIVGIQIYKSPTNDASTAAWAALTGLIGWATAKVGSIYDYRFGSSRGSATKDAVIAEAVRVKP